MKTPFDPSILQPGDAIIYAGHNVFDLLISFRTAIWASHIEIYIGDGKSVASRNGIGTGIYRLRLNDLKYVLRPSQPFDVTKAMAWFRSIHPMPYGWWELLNCLVPWEVNASGLFCSQFATLFYRAAAFFPFNQEFDPAKVTPRDFLEADPFTYAFTR